MKDQIVKIITDYLNKMEVPKEKWDGTVGFFPAEWPLPTCTIADEIAAAIAPHMEAGAGWEDAPDWAEFRTTTNSGDIIYWEHRPVCSPLGFWIAGNHSNRYEVREIKKGHLEQRPH